MLCYTILHYTTLHYTRPYHTIPYYDITITYAEEIEAAWLEEAGQTALELSRVLADLKA